MSETRKIAAILIADIVGYSRLAGADEDRTLARVRGLRSDLIDPAVAAHHGRIVKRTGDGSIVEFRSVVDAVRCAIEVQDGLVERNAGVAPERRIEFRMGIHLGDVVEEADGDLMGDGVNIAARLEGVCEPGAICLSEDAYRQVKGRLDLAVNDLGPIQLKNIAEPIRVYALQVGVAGRTKPSGPAAPKRRSAPAPLVALITALLVLALGSVWWFLGANRAASVASGAASTRLSIVVLPFANLSGDPAQDYLADVLTDELTTALARIRDSFVIARNTAFTLKGKPIDAKAIGKDLGVRYVLEGSVQPSGGQVRVNAQLIDADSGAHLWADQFDTARADLLQTQDEIVTRLARAMDIQLTGAEAARLKRTPAANPVAEDLALQCTGVRKAGYFGKDADAAYRFCEQALAADPNNVRALDYLSMKFYVAVALGVSADRNADLKRADELASKGLALDPNNPALHEDKGFILLAQSRLDESIAEFERELVLDPSSVPALGGLAGDYRYLGQFEKSLGLYDKAIRLSPHDPALAYWYNGAADVHFQLKQYEQTIAAARRAIAISPNIIPSLYLKLVAALALNGHETGAREAFQSYLVSVPMGPKTIAAWRAYQTAHGIDENSDPGYVDFESRMVDGLRKAGMPEE